MLVGAKDKVAASLTDINDVIARHGAPKSARKRRSNDQPAPLPKNLKKDIAQLEARQRLGRHLPYRTRQEEQFALTVRKKVQKHFRKKPDRPAALRRFLADYVLNLFYFAFLLTGVWYIATQL